ncbi:uncharacterized protein LOC123314597 isoform X1 [Coccinella septempunctata]|uniref:uncharacterized protein LOC123314597 isoform X1 n=1 Tax=Coccinella septempunctata TaxID=41139 RepID=UPI001D06C661|nr:uncharacterized protein LOC123314597 isoform X1 [Coccinella septempunctata]
MLSNKKYIYTLLTHNSKYYWKFLIAYAILMIILFGILAFCQVFSTFAIILSIVYIISLWGFTVWVTVSFLRKLFTKNQLCNWKIFEETKRIPTCSQSDRNNAHKLSEDVVNQFVKIWYNEISEDDKFPVESRIIIESTLNLLSKALGSIDKKHFAYVVTNVFLKHLKEFQRTLKLKEKNGDKISDMYRYSFSAIPNEKSCEYYIDQMTKKLLVNFIHWELWNSIPCKLVVSIISNKLSYLIDVCSDPEFLNYYLLMILLPEEQALELTLHQYTHIKLNPSCINVDLKEKVLQEEYIHEKESVPVDEHKSTVPSCSDSGIQPSGESEEVCEAIEVPFKKRKEVKVYEPRSSNEKWSETIDLATVTLGEDPLESPSQKKNISEAIDVLKDVKSDATSRAGDATVNTLRDIKDFQESTVNTVVKPVSHATSQALHKIGDFQDEAAGMVEGLFDLGMAGIRKGLKLTGLQENSTQEGMISESKNKHSLISPSVTNKKAKSHSNNQVAEECVWMNPLQHNIEDDVMGDTDEVDHVPSILMDSLEYGSPDPEYEEGADFATTIAKLRSLLQQKSSESISTTPVASPMMADSSKSLLDLEEVDGFIPSIYKVCAKTATGVFNNTLNTIKTALPATDDEMITYGLEKWEFETIEEKGMSITTRMSKLLQERKDFCMIETAYDAFDSQEPQVKRFISDVSFEETDDFESKVPLARTVTDIICELIADSDSLVTQEPFIKFLLLVFGKSIDEIIILKVEELFRNISLTEVPKSVERKVLTMDFDVYMKSLMSVLPDAVNLIASHSILNDALSTFILSLQMKKCNKDIVLQIFEFLILRLIEDNSKNNLLT